MERSPTGGDAPVVGGMLDPPVGTIEPGQARMIAQACQLDAGSVEESRVDVDGEDVALVRIYRRNQF